MKEPKEIRVDHTPTVRFSFDKESKINFTPEDETVGDEIAVTVIGKIESISEDSYGNSFSIRVKKIDYPCRVKDPFERKEKLSKAIARKRL